MVRRGLACLFTTLIVEDGNHSLMNDEAIPLRDQYIRQEIVFLLMFLVHGLSMLFV